MVDVPLKCSCGKIAGTATGVSADNRTWVVCHCDDCQAFARHLGCENDVLDANCGTDIFQMYPGQFQVAMGVEQIRSMRLTSNGLLRWYTNCCNTPVGNTVSGKLPFIGMIHSFMDDQGAPDQDLGPVRY